MNDLFNAPDWIDQALCAKVGDPSDWFPESSGEWIEELAAARQAIQVCNQCPVRLKCLQMALDTEVVREGQPSAASARHGIYGGLTPTQRAALAGGTAVDKLPRSTGLRRSKFTPPACGTESGYQAHRWKARNNTDSGEQWPLPVEDPCGCREAHRAVTAAYTARKRGEVA